MNPTRFALYQRIKDNIIQEMDSGGLKPDEGRIVRIQGVGSIVSRPQSDTAFLEI